MLPCVMCNTVLESWYMLIEKLALAERFMKLAMFGYLAIMFFKCVCVCVCVCVGGWVGGWVVYHFK